MENDDQKQRRPCGNSPVMAHRRLQTTGMFCLAFLCSLFYFVVGVFVFSLRFPGLRSSFSRSSFSRSFRTPRGKPHLTCRNPIWPVSTLAEKKRAAIAVKYTKGEISAFYFW